MHPIISFLKSSGSRLLRARIGRLLSYVVLVAMTYLFFYFVAVLSIKTMSLTYAGAFTVPALCLLALLILAPYQWWLLRNPRTVAKYLEEHHPELGLKLRSSLDFIEGRTDNQSKNFSKAFLDQVAGQLATFSIRDPQSRPWGRYATAAFAFTFAFWLMFDGPLLKKFYNPGISIGQTHLNLSEGSITIFEPDYTQIPGRTLPLKPGSFEAYAGSRVRFMITLPENARALYLSTGADAEPIPLRIGDENNVSHEFVLTEDIELRFLLSESDDSGRTAPYIFATKEDGAPEITLRSHTPEGPLNILDPLIVESEIKDDFGVKELFAVVTWEGQEKRISLSVPPDRRKHFINRNQWYISDFGIQDADSFSIYLEAKDNQPIGDPGIGTSPTLTYELESPDKKYDEFMELARQLLDTMTHSLGDNLETPLDRAGIPGDQQLRQAESMGRQIGTGLYNSLNITHKLIGKVRETPNLTRLDQNFLYQFRNRVSTQARTRSEVNTWYGKVLFHKDNRVYRNLVTSHAQEELGVEDLTYDLLLQLKMWAVLELERQKNQLENDMDSLEELLENAENMDEQELMKMAEQMMSELMKEFQEMMANAAEQMEMSMNEFMNQDAMQEAGDMFEELKKQIMDALREGDMEKAKALMEQMRAQMQEAMQAMNQQMGEMSPEMQAMMENMRELMGLLRELKSGEEELEASTQELKKEIDKQLGGNEAELNEQQREEQRKITEKIQKMLNDLYNRLVEYKTESMVQDLVNQIAEARQQLEEGNLSSGEINQLRRDVNRQERMLDFLSRDGLDRLQNMTLRNLDQVEKMQEYLDQGEFMLGLETGLKLETSLIQSERLSEQTPSRRIQEETQPTQTFRDAREELYKILDALQNMRNNMEDRRQQHMQAQTGEQRQQQLAEQQKKLEEMIQEFMERTGETFDGTQIADKLQDIGLSMKNAEQRLAGSRLDGGIQHQQSALQKIGEMMEQLQQSQQPSGSPRPMMSMNRQQGFQGDPSLEDIYIPESQKQATRDRMKDRIRKQLKKNLPDSYGKEIRKYYDKLMDQ